MDLRPSSGPEVRMSPLFLLMALMQEPVAQSVAQPGQPVAQPAPSVAVARPLEPGQPGPYGMYVPGSASEPRRRVVVAFLPSLTMGISPLPSHNPALFVGGRLRGAWALGYQLTLSMGLAERYFLGLYTHRHHVTAMRPFGATGRGFVSVGGGAAFLITNPVVEVEGRVGLRWGSKKYGVVGVMMRLGWDVGHREQAPMPQLGVFFGVAVF
jgi:hypothetical protein